MLASYNENSFSSTADEGVYQAVSRAAIASCVLGVMGILSFWLVPILLLPVLGFVFAIIGFRNLRRYKGELTGRPAAILGLAICGITLAIAPALHAYVYVTEVPEGYERINFSQLKSPYIDADIPPESAMELNGKSVFLKGYIHPTSIASSSARRFVLVPDLGTCCFGGQPKLTHMVEVTLSGDKFASYGMRQVKLAGTLLVDNQLKPVSDLQGVYYQLKADVYRD
ncbi:MAG: DUF3299 domain-containing protein [Pirellulaceae bacterium]|nr:DUF3299 domain-containing protein [Pirellulaceae bacterium]